MDQQSVRKSAVKVLFRQLTTDERATLGLSLVVLAIGLPLACYGFSHGQYALGLVNTVTLLLFMARAGWIIRDVGRRRPMCG
jgi:hypothetical protein